jgi:hypothetical protein
MRSWQVGGARAEATQPCTRAGGCGGATGKSSTNSRSKLVRNCTNYLRLYDAGRGEGMATQPQQGLVTVLRRKPSAKADSSP